MRPRRISRSIVAAIAVASTLACTACSSADGTPNGSSTALPADAPADTQVSESEQQFPDVIDAEAVATSAGWTFSVTISSPYDSPDRYADGWRVVGADGTEYGFRLLTHDHAAEQPFTRSLAGVQIPADVTTVTIEARDQVHGYGGATFELALPSG